jgi:hypothetical protein
MGTRHIYIGLSPALHLQCGERVWSLLHTFGPTEVWSIMVAMLGGTVYMITLLTSAAPPAAQIFESGIDMYGYYNTTSNTSLSGLERIHEAFSQVVNIFT